MYSIKCFCGRAKFSFLFEVLSKRGATAAMTKLVNSKALFLTLCLNEVVCNGSLNACISTVVPLWRYFPDERRWASADAVAWVCKTAEAHPQSAACSPKHWPSSTSIARPLFSQALIKEPEWDGLKERDIKMRSVRRFQLVLMNIPGGIEMLILLARLANSPNREENLGGWKQPNINSLTPFSCSLRFWFSYNETMPIFVIIIPIAIHV